MCTSRPADPAGLWDGIRLEASTQLAGESCFGKFGLDNFLQNSVMQHETLADGLSYHIGGKLAANDLGAGIDYRAIISNAMDADPEIAVSTAADLDRFRVVDPAVTGL